MRVAWEVVAILAQDVSLGVLETAMLHVQVLVVLVLHLAVVSVVILAMLIARQDAVRSVGEVVLLIVMVLVLDAVVAPVAQELVVQTALEHVWEIVLAVQVVA